MLGHKRLFLFDIDGTVAIDESLLDGSLELFHWIDSIGGKSIFITNNSTRSVQDYIEKFARMGISTDETNFITASVVTVRYLRQHYNNQKVFVAGTRSLIRELRANGIHAIDRIEDGIACVLVGFDNELTYQKIEQVCELLFTRQVDYLATNPDLACPVGFGAIPDCGAICRLIGCAVKREPIFLGKPNPAMVELCLEQTGFSKAQTLVVGDRLYTDIACGINAGVDTAVVFTGEARPSDLQDTPYPPTWAFQDVQKLLETLTTA